MDNTQIKNETFRQTRYNYDPSNKASQILTFPDTTPNTAFIRNYGSDYLYVSARSIPSVSDYDQIIGSGALTSLVKLQPFDRLFFYSASPCSLNIESFVTENLKPADIPETQQMTFINNQPVTIGNIFQILSALPSGSNIIGKVEAGTILSATLTQLISLVTQNNTLVTQSNTLLQQIVTNTTPKTP